MKVADIMRTEVKTVDIDATVGDAIATLADVHVSALPVTDTRGLVVGVLSTTDILNALSETTEPEAREQMFNEPVRDLMTPRSRVIAPDADVLEAARQMLSLEVHRLFVEDRGRLVGVISQTDIVAAVATAKI
ncbi:MAG TPA: CBS domain-containing protein [Gemmatimonadales bacterium]|nr:CBS domain-containing protein [Gemmatimonadales bacterium]